MNPIILSPSLSDTPVIKLRACNTSPPNNSFSTAYRVLKEAERGGITAASRLYGITRSTIHEWRKSVEPKKRGPRQKVPWQTETKIERIIIKFRKATNYGPKRLKHELQLIGLTVGEKAIRGVLNRNSLTRCHKKKRIRKQQKFYAPYPGYRIQIDTKAVPDEGDLRSAKRHQFTAIDIATKLRFTHIYSELSNSNSIDFLKKVISFFHAIGIEIECIQTDNHSTFTNIYIGGNKKADHELRRVHPFTKFCLNQNIAHKLSRPGTPRHNCFVERSHRTDEEEFYRLLDLSVLDNQKLLLEMQKWQHRYNFLRLHSSCGNMPPFKYYLTVLQTGSIHCMNPNQ